MSEQKPEDVDIQTGTKGVAPTDLDAAGDDHPLGSKSTELQGDFQVIVRDYADGQYSSWKETVREYIANAETACIRVQQRIEEGKELLAPDNYEPVIDIVWDRKEQKFTIKDNGVGMSSYEFEQGFSFVGGSASRDDGGRLGQFGVGALSFVQVAGIDSHILVKTHSRLTDENYSAYFSLGGPTPLVGGLNEKQYGTVFEMTPKEDFDFRAAVDEYSEYVSVPVRYTEYNEDGEEVFNEDYGDKRLLDEISSRRVAIEYEKEGYFRAVCAPECDGKTLLVSMPIDRNDGGYGSGQHSAPFTFDVRLLDETGRVVKGPNEGMIPCSWREYEDMLIDARDPHLPPDLLDDMDAVMHDGEPTNISDLHKENIIGKEIVVGKNEGKVVVQADEWDSMDEGRAAQYIPEEKLTDDDLTMPKPTSDRGRLEEHRDFWKWLANNVEEKFYSNVKAVKQEVKGSNDPVEHIINMEKGNLSLARHGIEHARKSDSVTGQSHGDLAHHFDVDAETIALFDNLNDELSVVPDGKWDYPDSSYHREDMTVEEILRSNSFGEVYLAATVTRDKAKKVMEDGGLVIDVDHAGLYPKYEIYNWNKLKDVTVE